MLIKLSPMILKNNNKYSQHSVKLLCARNILDGIPSLQTKCDSLTMKKSISMKIHFGNPRR